MMRTLLVVGVFMLFGCDPPSPPPMAIPPPPPLDTASLEATARRNAERARAEAERTVLGQATRELSCPQVRVLQMYARPYSNSTSLRYLVEGCGQRALYSESCSSEPCSYFLVLRYSMSTAGPLP
jgi:hypothetical protein